MDRENNSSYLHQKVDSLEEQVVVITRKCTEYDISEQKKRVADEKDVKRVKDWFLDKEWRDGKFKTSLDNLQKQLEAYRIEDKRQNAAIDKLSDEINQIHEKLHRSTGSKAESEASDKLQNMIKIVETLQKNQRTPIDHSGNKSEFDREIKMVTDNIVQNGGEEDNRNEMQEEKTREYIEKLEKELNNQSKEIKSSLIDHSLFVKSTNLGLRSIREDIAGYNEFRNTTIDRVCFLRSNLDEIDFYAREMYNEQREQKSIIDCLSLENRNLREDYTKFQEKMFAEIRSLREGMEEMKANDHNKSEKVTSSKSVQCDSSDSVNSSPKAKSFVPIQEAIIGEWKMIACQNMEKLCDENKSLNLAIRKKEQIRINISQGKFTTYFNDNGVYKKEERFKQGKADGLSNRWFPEKNSIKSFNYMGSANAETAERCTRYINQKQNLVILNEINGRSATRVYERIS